MSKIQLTDSVFDVLKKVSEGNPGALNVCMRLIREGEYIDPDNIMGGIGIVLSLDGMEIYGSRIWMLYKDVCKEDLVDMVAELRSRQLGFVSDNDINIAIDNYGKGIDVAECYKKVKSKLPKFADHN